MAELTQAMREFLDKTHFAVVATIRSDGVPHQTVMWYALQSDDTLLLNTPFDSLKHRQLRDDPRISVCIEDGYRYVTLRGTAALDENPEQARQDYMRLGQRYRETFFAPPPGAGSDRPAILDRERVTLRLNIEYITANGF